MDTTEDKVLNLLNVGDKSAFEVLFHTFYPSLCYFASKILKDDDVARDIVQELFIYMIDKKYKFENFIILKSFLYKSVRNKCFSYIGKINSREQIHNKIASNQTAVTDYDVQLHEVESDIFEQIFLAVETLPEECSKVFKMSYLENLDVKTISEMLGIATSTIMTQRQRAKKILKSKLKNIDLVILNLFFT